MRTATKNILIVATLDTKSDEAGYLQQLIRDKGHNPIVMDVGTFGSPSFVADVTSEEIARAGDSEIKGLVERRDEGEAIAVMALGASRIVRQMSLEGRLHGLVAIGGSMGTFLGLKVIKEVPINVPKLMVSTIAFTPLVVPESVSVDLVMMQTIADLWGLNPVTRMVLQRAAGAICGMAEQEPDEAADAKPLVAVTTLGSSVHVFADYCKPLLGERGYEPVVFHTVGTNSCEKLAREGYLAGVLNLSMFELANYVCGGAIKGGEETLNAACEKGVPQVVAPGALEWFQWSGTLDTLPAKYQDRVIHMHNPTVFQVQTSVEEKVEVAEIMAERLQKAVAPAKVLIPLNGFSKMDEEGMLFHDPVGRKAFVEALEQKLTSGLVEIIKLDTDINSPLFAERAVGLLDDLMHRAQGR